MRLQQRYFSVTFAKLLRTSFKRAPPDDCFLCLSMKEFPQIKEAGPYFVGGSNSAERPNYLVPPSVFLFSIIERPKFLIIHQISMHFTWFSSTSLSFYKFPKIRVGGPNLFGRINSAERLNYLVPPSILLLYIYIHIYTWEILSTKYYHRFIIETEFSWVKQIQLGVCGEHCQAPIWVLRAKLPRKP